jgi:hypothetical protein
MSILSKWRVQSYFKRDLHAMKLAEATTLQSISNSSPIARGAKKTVDSKSQKRTFDTSERR